MEVEIDGVIVEDGGASIYYGNTVVGEFTLDPNPEGEDTLTGMFLDWPPTEGGSGPSAHRVDHVPITFRVDDGTRYTFDEYIVSFDHTDEELWVEIEASPRDVNVDHGYD